MIFVKKVHFHYTQCSCICMCMSLSCAGFDLHFFYTWWWVHDLEYLHVTSNLECWFPCEWGRFFPHVAFFFAATLKSLYISLSSFLPSVVSLVVSNHYQRFLNFEHKKVNKHCHAYQRHKICNSCCSHCYQPSLATQLRRWFAQLWYRIVAQFWEWRW